MASSTTSAASLPACLLEPFPPPLEAPMIFEGADVSLATEVLPPPPPLFTKDGKRPTDYLRKRAIPSYLPALDPGSTYNSGTGVKAVEYVATEDEGSDRGPKRKRSRLEKADANPPKQSSSRNPSPHIGDPATAFTEVSAPETAGLADLEVDRVASPSASVIEHRADAPATALPPHMGNIRARRSSSLLAASRLSQLDWSLSGNGAGKRKDGDPSSSGKAADGDAPMDAWDDSLNGKDGSKGKGKEKADEHVNSSDCTTCSMSLLYSPTPSVYCDGCPRSFHLSCLDPPLDEKDIGKGQWFCVRCAATRTVGPQRSVANHRTAGPFADLINRTATDFPSVFLLPEDIRTYFRDVGTTSDGVYIETGDLRVPKPSRPGILEDRDPYRLRDRQGLATLCYKCGLSSMPPNTEDSAGEPVTALPDSNAARNATAIANGPNGSLAPLTDHKSSRGLSPPHVTSNSAEVREPNEDEGTVLLQAGPWRPSPVLIKEEPVPIHLDAPKAPPPRRSSRRSAAASSTPPSVPSTGSSAEPGLKAKTIDVTDLAEPIGPGIKLPVGNTVVGWKAMISCDFCQLSWHLDCLDPPLVVMPPNHKKWMCPNHADHVIPKRRTPRHIRTVTVASIPQSSSARKTFGNIEIIPAPSTSRSSQPSTAVSKAAVSPITIERSPIDNRVKKRKRTSLDSASHGADDFIINGVKYRLPEHVVRLNFWNFKGKKDQDSTGEGGSQKDRASLIRERARRTLSSGSSLSSLSDPSESEGEVVRPQTSRSDAQYFDHGAQLAAEALLAMHRPIKRQNAASEPSGRRTRNRQPSNAMHMEQVISAALPSKGRVSSTPSKVTHTPSKKPVSSSYKIRIPGLASRIASSAAASQSDISGTKSVLSSPERPPKAGSVTSSSSLLTLQMIPGDPDDSTQNQASLTGAIPSSSQTSDVSSLSAEEIEQLRAVRELMAVKGKQALLDFLRS